MRPIDADALIDTIAIIAKKFAKTDAQKALMGRVIYHLEHKPECIVRCKDCKHAQRQVLKKSGGFEGWICEYDQEHFIAGDHFCSRGQRGEE